MSRQIAARLPDEIVAFIDARVASGAAPNRAAWLMSAARRQRNYELAQRDAAIYARHGEDPELAGLVAWGAEHPVELGD